MPRTEWRSSANSVGNVVGNGKVQKTGPGQGLRADQSPCGLGLGNALQLPKEDLAGAMRALRASESSAVLRMCGGTAPDHDGYFARVEVELSTSTSLCFRTRCVRSPNSIRL